MHKAHSTGGFWLILGALLLAASLRVLFWFFVASVVHELGHWAMVRTLGGRVGGFSLTGTGAVIRPSRERLFSYGEECLVAAGSGPGRPSQRGPGQGRGGGLSRGGSLDPPPRGEFHLPALCPVAAPVAGGAGGMRGHGSRDRYPHTAHPCAGIPRGWSPAGQSLGVHRDAGHGYCWPPRH